MCSRIDREHQQGESPALTPCGRARVGADGGADSSQRKTVEHPGRVVRPYGGEPMRVVSWNVNGIRVCVRRGFVDFLNSVRSRHRRRPGGPRAARGHPTGRPSAAGLAHGVHGRRAPGL